MRIVFIAGAGRSGSTLLARLAGQCADCVAVGELRHLGHSGAADSHPGMRCGCGQTFDACPFWTSIVHGLAAKGDDPRRFEQLRLGTDRIRYIPRILWGRDTTAFAQRKREVCSFLEDIYRLIADHSGSSTVVDSSKDPSFLFLLQQIRGLQVDVVHLVRDPRAVAYSWITKKRLPEVVGKKAYMRTYRPARSAAFWVVTNLLAEVGGRRAASYQRVRYEDFMRDPAGTVKQMVGERTNPTFIQGSTAKLVEPEHLVKGNPDRFRTGAVEISADERWKKGLEPTRRLVVSLLCWPLMIRYGYRWADVGGGRTGGV